MTPELSSRLESIVGFLETSVKQAGQFAVEQAPDVVQQLLAWKFYKSLITSGLLLPIAAAYLVILFLGLYRKWDLGHSSPSPWGLFLLLAWIPSAVALAVGMYSFFEAIKILIAPKLYLLEYAASLLQ